MYSSTRSYDPRILGLQNALSSVRESTKVFPKKEHTAYLPADSHTASQEWSKSSTCIATGARVSMQVALIYFSAVQDNHALSSTITTITF